MKKNLLLFLLLAFSIGFARPKTTPPSGPSIGLIMIQDYSIGNYAFISFRIKNTGTETLTNIYLDNLVVNSSNIQIYTNPPGTNYIASLEPGEEDLSTFYGNKDFFCLDPCQAVVYATTLSNTQISDLSSDNSYYGDNPTYLVSYIYTDPVQNGLYEDTNNNSIIDVGDVINYTYTVNSSDYVTGTISDNNAIVANPSFNDITYTTTGIHYITQADVDLGYVYNSSNVIVQNICGNAFYGIFTDASSCSCPNPSNSNIVTPLTSALPNRISGTVKFNLNNDDCATGFPFSHRRVNTADTNNNTYASFPNDNGQYHILIPNLGDYTTSALSDLGPNYTSSPPSVTITSLGENQDYSTTDFCINSATGFADLGVGMYGFTGAVPGTNAGYNFYYYNNGSTPLSGSVELAFDGTKLTFNNASTLPDSSTANTLTWNYTNLLPFQWKEVSLGFSVLTPPTVNINDVLTFTLTGNPIAGDNNPANNTATWNQIVRSSYDPNDKTVVEGATISTAQTGNYLNYVTRFQNTGTANATTVVIKETLDPKLDWNTFEPIASSHASNVQIKNGNEVTYTFSNIGLAYESANEPASHGWMAYRIKPKSNVVLGDVMSSKSDIYFDYNPPIITNAVSTEVTALATADFVKSNFVVYPNPAANYIIIESKTAVASSYEVLDLNGKSLLHGETQSLSPINISMLQSGFYFLNIKTNSGKATYKFIKN